MSLSMTMAGYGISVCLSVEVAGAACSASSAGQQLQQQVIAPEDLLPALAAAMPEGLLEAHRKLSAVFLQEVSRIRSAEVDAANRALSQEVAQ